MSVEPEWVEDLMKKAVEFSHEEGPYREMFVQFGTLMVQSLPPEHQGKGPLYKLLIESLISLASTAALFAFARSEGVDVQEIHDHILYSAEKDQKLMGHVEKLVEDAKEAWQKPHEEDAKAAWAKWRMN